jgi:hypothetical protein
MLRARPVSDHRRQAGSCDGGRKILALAGQHGFGRQEVPTADRSDAALGAWVARAVRGA